MWGRSLYQNIQRFIIFQLTINLTAMLIVLLGTLLGHDLPLTVTQMLWVNLIMDTFAALAMALKDLVDRYATKSDGNIKSV
jgi:Ca2+-transporting ATPase